MKSLESHDDPRLTAYALGELDDNERAAVEALLARSPQARAAVEELVLLGSQLRRELADEATPGLDPERRSALEASLAGARPRQGTLVRLWLPAAAALLLGAFAWRTLLLDGSAQERGGVPAESSPVARGDRDESDAIRRPPEESRDLRERAAPGRVEAERNLGLAGGGAGEASPAAGPVTTDLGRGTAEPPAAATLLPARDAESAHETPIQEVVQAPLSTDSTGANDVIGLGGLAAREAVGRAGHKAGRAVAPAASEREASDQLQILQGLGYLGRAAHDDGRRDESVSSEFARPRPSAGGEAYAPILDNPFVPLTADPTSALSTFGVDVDTASYSNVRRFLNRGQRPPRDAVRLEELLNHFDYGYPEPQGEVPFSVVVEVASAPWAPAHRLVRVGLKGRTIELPERPASNLVFLLDVSGSMSSPDKLPLLVSSLKLLLRQLDERDRVALVTYANGSQLVLPSTSCADRATIEVALDGLSAGGSTHASAGLQLAYEVAAKGFLPEGTNRVMLATDGDFNVGITGEGELERFIAEKAKGGVFLTVLGFGTGNLKDSKAEILADRGNGHYAYIDSLAQAHEVLVAELGGTLITIAKDVKVQVEFNPAEVAAYRLLGYENRALAAADFRNDRKDAGEIGAGHTVTALYEVVPVGVAGLAGTAELRYQRPPPAPEALVPSDELLTVNLRFKLPDGDEGRELAVPLVDGGASFEQADADLRFAAAVAAFGMILRESSHRGEVDCARVAEWAEAARGSDPQGERAEFVRLVRVAQGLLGS